MEITEHRLMHGKVSAFVVDSENLMWYEFKSNGNAIRINIDSRTGRIYITATEGKKLIVLPQSSNVIEVKSEKLDY